MSGDLGSQPQSDTADSIGFGISILDRFIEPDNNDSHWLTAVELSLEIGYPFLNIAAVSKYNGAPLWVRTTMSPEWAELYLGKNFFHHDPFIEHMKRSNDQIVLDFDEPLDSDADSKLLEFQSDAKRLGYGRFRGIPFNWPTQPVYRIISFGLPSGQGENESTEMILKARLLAEVLATRIAAPSTEIGRGVMWPRKTILTDRERELLSYLAMGLKNDRIAERCGLAEVTVRKHILSARQKLGATTREQALAIALQNGLILH